MPTTRIDGAEVFWEMAGESGDPLVLVHGSWGDHHNWAGVVPQLARSFRVLTYDRRGHSQSERLPTPGSAAEDASDLAALIRGLDLGPSHIVGNSFGASIVARAACATPELFRSMAVHEPPLFDLLAADAESAPALDAFRQRAAAVVATLQAGETTAGARLFVETIAFGPGAWDGLPEEVQQTFIANAPTWLDELQDPTWARVDLDALARFTSPVLLTCGDQSPPFFPAVVDRLASALPRADRHVFTGAGHVPHITHPDAWVDAITASATR